MSSVRAGNAFESGSLVTLDVASALLYAQRPIMAKVQTPAGDTHAATVGAYPPALRAAAAGLLGVSGVALAALLGRALLVSDPPTTAAVLRTFLAVSAVPALAVWLLRRALVARVDIVRNALQVTVGGQRHVAPLGSIAAIEPWRLPLPQPGLTLRQRDGARFALGLAADDPSPIVARLVAAGVADAAGALDHPTLVYGRARAAAGRLTTRRLIAKFVFFGALVAGVVFNAHQTIAYGGVWGRWELEGALPFAQEFARYWVAATLYLVLYATAWRWLAEIVAWLAARRGQHVADRVRRSVELVCRLAYFAGVPALLALRLAQ